MKLTGDKLMEYVEKKGKDAQEREDRLLEREARMKDKELEENEQKRQHELEMFQRRCEQGATTENQQINANKSYIKLAPFKLGDDVDLYLRNFEKGKAANNWSEVLGITELQNGFSFTPVARLISSLPRGHGYEEMKKEILKTFGNTIFDYLKKFSTIAQGGDISDNLCYVCPIIFRDGVNYVKAILLRQ